MSAIDYTPFEVLTFDCYGTLIDWETGIAAAMTDALGEHPREQLLELFGRHEHEAEVPYRLYREVLAETLRNVAAELGVQVTDEHRHRSLGGAVVLGERTGAGRRAGSAVRR